MYSLVLATALTAGSASPEFIHISIGCHGCHGCFGCGGGNAFSCHGCFGCGGGCFGCFGCGGGCYGCYGGGFGGGYAAVGFGGYGACCGGCYGCFGGGGLGGSWGCYGGCYGAVAYGCCGGYAPHYQAPTMPKAKEPKKDDEASAPSAPATVVVKAPADGVLKVNGQRTPRRASEETYLTPDLRPGNTYSYVFTVEATHDGKPVTLTKRVTVRAGERTTVDFGAKEVAAAARR